MKYIIKDNSIWRIGLNDEIEIGSRLAIAWSYDPELPGNIKGSIHKIGPPEFVERWLDGVVERLGPDAFKIFGFLGLLTFDLDNIPIKEVNKMIDITGYIGTYLEQEGIIEKAIALKKSHEGV